MPFAFRPHIGSRGVDEQRTILDPVAAREGEDVAALCPHRNVDPRHGGKLASARTGAIDEGAASDPGAVLEENRHDLVAVALDPRDLALHILRAERTGLLAERLQKPPAVEPALSRPAPGAGREVVGVQPREAGLQVRRIEQQDIGALAGLEGLVLPQDVGAGIGGAIEIAALFQVDLGALAIDRQMLADAAQERDSVKRDADIHRGRILLPDRGRRERRGGELVGRVLFDDHHAPAEAGIGQQVVGGGGAHDGAAYDHDIGGVGAGEGHRSNFVERMMEDCVRSTPSTAPIRSIAASSRGTSSASTTASRSKTPATE